MPKGSSKAKRKIYDKNYYKAQAMLRDPWFIEKIAWLKNRFTEVGCPVPTNGFKTYDQYQKWRDKYWDTRSRMYQDKEFIAGVKEITGGKEKISLEEYNALEAFKENFLPPVYGAVFHDILEHFKIKHDDGHFRDFVEWYVFLGRTEYPATLVRVTNIRNEKSGQMELFVQIFGYTKKEDIVNHWNFIVQDQKRLPDYIGKSKEWEAFDRDLEIYNLYKKIKTKEYKEESPFKVIALDDEIWVRLHEKYPSITMGNIRNIVTKTKKRLGE